MSIIEMKWRESREEMMAESAKNKHKERTDRLVLRRRWQNAYDLFQQGDFVNALNVFELIEVCDPEAPTEVSLNKLLSLIASGILHPIEVKSRLLASHLGPIFLFAIGVYLEEMDPEESLNSFKKCLYSLKDSSPMHDAWSLHKFIVYINLAIMSNIVEDKTLANLYLNKAEDVADDEEALNFVRKYKSKGLNGARCIRLPKEFCIPPPSPKETKTRSWLEIFDEDNDSVDDDDRKVDGTDEELGNLADENVDSLESYITAESANQTAPGKRLQICTQTQNHLDDSNLSDESDDNDEDESPARPLSYLLTPPDELENQFKLPLHYDSASSSQDQSAEKRKCTNGGLKIPPRESSRGQLHLKDSK